MLVMSNNNHPSGGIPTNVWNIIITAYAAALQITPSKGYSVKYHIIYYLWAQRLNNLQSCGILYANIGVCKIIRLIHGKTTILLHSITILHYNAGMMMKYGIIITLLLLLQINATYMAGPVLWCSGLLSVQCRPTETDLVPDTRPGDHIAAELFPESARTTHVCSSLAEISLKQCNFVNNCC